MAFLAITHVICSVLRSYTIFHFLNEIEFVTIELLIKTVMPVKYLSLKNWLSRNSMFAWAEITQSLFL